MFVVKRRKSFIAGGSWPWHYLCIGKVNKYCFLPRGNWEMKYLIKPLDTEGQARATIKECLRLYKVPQYEYVIVPFEEIAVQMMIGGK